MDNRKRASYGIIKTIGGIFMPRSYRHMQDYEKEIMELREQGLNRSERSSVLSIMRNIKKRKKSYSARLFRFKFRR